MIDDGGKLSDYAKIYKAEYNNNVEKIKSMKFPVIKKTKPSKPVRVPKLGWKCCMNHQVFDCRYKEILCNHY